MCVWPCSPARNALVIHSYITSPRTTNNNHVEVPHTPSPEVTAPKYFARLDSEPQTQGAMAKAAPNRSGNKSLACRVHAHDDGTATIPPIAPEENGRDS